MKKIKTKDQKPANQAAGQTENHRVQQVENKNAKTLGNRSINKETNAFDPNFESAADRFGKPVTTSKPNNSKQGGVPSEQKKSYRSHAINREDLGRCLGFDPSITFPAHQVV